MSAVFGGAGTRAFCLQWISHEFPKRKRVGGRSRHPPSRVSLPNLPLLKGERPMTTTITTTSIHRKASLHHGGKDMPKRVLSRTALCLIGLVLALLPLPALAITLVPTGLNPGDTYHLAFLTSTTRVATSFAIADYNAFVQAAADAVVGIGAGDGFTWKAIASTSSDDARDNIGVITSPIYRLDDTLIASDESDLFDGTLLAALNITE